MTELDALPHRISAKAYLRSQKLDPGNYTLEALQRFGMMAARIARSEGWPDQKVAEDGFTVHTWPPAVWGATISAMLTGRQVPSPPATPRQIGYLMILAVELGASHQLMDRLTHPMTMDEASTYLDKLKAMRRAAGRRPPAGPAQPRYSTRTPTTWADGYGYDD